ncbi:hypothetical protein G5714_023734 [Onychostoma macrolepis]|uniref:Uncharacterized protein n=1 Tax=Onychostoma macrolepis TaxID=369639 RepID=A0A7J6BN70_9TELE|nr:hypothetical protein G5714_023734 [Onychostoma macrolepis]
MLTEITTDFKSSRHAQEPYTKRMLERPHPVPNEQGGLHPLLQSKAEVLPEEHGKTGSFKLKSRRLLVKVCVGHLLEKGELLCFQLPIKC